MLIQILCCYLATLIDYAHLQILTYNLSIIYLYAVVEAVVFHYVYLKAA